jgi:iron complex transport system permease protein
MTLSARPDLLGGLVALLALGVLGSLAVGAVPIPVDALLRAVVGIEALEQAQWMVLSTLRAPRIVMGALVGAALATSGALMQGLFRNPLASPSLIGVSTGASCGAALAIVLFAAVPALMPVFAFLGAMVATLVVLRLGTRHGRSDTASILLAGIAVNAVAGAVTGLMLYLADDTQLRMLTFFTLGSIGGATWSRLWWTVPFALVPVVAGPLLAGRLNALLLGESEARHLGVDVERLKRVLVAVVCLGVAGCVAATGVIGFVGLAVPHVIRLAAGPDHHVVVPGSALFGAALLVIADSAARTVVAPAELPIGILTTLLGGPFFLALLIRYRRGLG